MVPDQPITAYSFASGAQRGTHFTLFPGRLVHEGGDAAEHMPLAHLAAVRIEFAREPRKLKWAIIFLVVAVILNAVSAPLQRVADAAAGEIAEHAKREGMQGGGVSGALQATFRALERGAAALPTVGLALAAWAAALLALFWYGRTTLTLTLAAVERAYSVRGRDRMLMEFAESLSTRLAELPG
jgi:hypothetical protein